MSRFIEVVLSTKPRGVRSSRFRAPSGSDRKTAYDALWIQSDGMTAIAALLSERSEAFIAEPSSPWKDGRDYRLLFEKRGSIPASFSFGFSVHVARIERERLNGGRE